MSEAPQTTSSEPDPPQPAVRRSLLRRVLRGLGLGLLALFMTGRVYDDGIIDPRDTRTVLGMCLSAIDNQPIEGTRGYGVYRM